MTDLQDLNDRDALRRAATELREEAYRDWPRRGSCALRQVAHKLELTKAQLHGCLPDWGHNYLIGNPNQHLIEALLREAALTPHPTGDAPGREKEAGG